MCTISHIVCIPSAILCVYHQPYCVCIISHIVCVPSAILCVYHQPYCVCTISHIVCVYHQPYCVCTISHIVCMCLHFHSVSITGDYGFRLDFTSDTKITKSISHTVSDALDFEAIMAVSMLLLPPSSTLTLPPLPPPLSIVPVLKGYE